MARQMNIVTLGGGSQSRLLQGMASNPCYRITAVCTASDSGGDTGRSVEDYGKAGVNGSLGDVSKCLCALGKDRKLKEELLYRFSTGNRKGESLKNSLYLGYIHQYGPERGLMRMHELLKVPKRHRVIPATFERTRLMFRLANKVVVSGETNLDNIANQKLWSQQVHGIRKVWLSNKVKAYAGAIEAIAKADYIIISPGDLFTSVIPVLLVDGIAEAIAASAARVIIVMNLMTKLGETDGYNAADFIRMLQKHMCGRTPDVVLCNSNGIPPELLEQYRSKEHKVKMVPDSLKGSEYEHIQVVRSDLWAATPEGRIVHDPQKLSMALKKVFASQKRGRARLAA